MHTTSATQNIVVFRFFTSFTNAGGLYSQDLNAWSLQDLTKNKKQNKTKKINKTKKLQIAFENLFDFFLNPYYRVDDTL